MGQKYNRKQIRHRPMRNRRAIDLSISTTSLSNSTLDSYAAFMTKCPRPHDFSTNLTRISQPPLQDSIIARELRIFGGTRYAELGDDELVVPMLDVVLSLFGSIDYDDLET